MESYIIDWFSLLFRWLHVITGIAWIGASFYFIWLDNSLEDPPQWKKEKGIKGDLWAIHGGGIYEVAKYQLEPEKMPTRLHWFKWEAYTTWLTGFVLLSIIYYIGAESYLIDPRVADLSKTQAILIGLSFIAGSWIIYELICSSPMGTNTILTGVILSFAAIAVAYALTHLFSGRGAYIHFGSILGTIMAGNVFRIIIPGQKALLTAIEKGETPNPEWAQKAKLHSTHNTYITLPLIFIMISNHYPMTYTHEFNWIVLLSIVVVTALARIYFVLRHKHVNKPILLIASSIGALAIAITIAPQQTANTSSNNVTDPYRVVTQVQWIVEHRCRSCHSSNNSDPIFTSPQGGVILDSMADIRQWAPRIKARAIDSNDMPFMNKTGMTDEERAILSAWFSSHHTP